jgi:hypothetical protein
MFRVPSLVLMSFLQVGWVPQMQYMKSGLGASVWEAVCFV